MEISSPRFGANRRRVAIAAVAGLLLLFAAWPRERILPAPEPWAGEWPAAQPPAGLRIYRVPTGITYRTAAFGYTGGSLFERRQFAMDAVFIDHPKGGVLVDTGFGREIERHVLALPWLLRRMAAYEARTPAAEQLAAAGFVSRVTSILLTHAHWDHVSGIPDFPGVPVLVPGPERRYVDEGGVAMNVARALGPVPWQEYVFNGPPYLGFPASHDLFGDGSVVAVPSPGHTPGSVIVFVSEADGRRWALLGDLVWQLEGIEELCERPWVMRRLVDFDEDGVRAGIAHVAALARMFPQLRLVPAHDGRAYEGMEALPRGAALAGGVAPFPDGGAGAPGAGVPFVVSSWDCAGRPSAAADSASLRR